MLAALLATGLTRVVEARTLTMEVVRPLTVQRSPGAYYETALLIRSALDNVEQECLYCDLCSAANASFEWQRLCSDEEQPHDSPWPLCVWQHPFTDETNANAEPAPVFLWAQVMARQAACNLRSGERGALSDDEAAELVKLLEAVDYDSLVSLLYREGGSLQRHVDKGMDGLGVAVSFGASSTFEYGGTHVDLHSGDALFAPFGHVPHQVIRMHATSSAPKWWHAMPLQPCRRNSAAQFATGCSFGRVRCSLQLRDVTRRRREVGLVRDAAALRARQDASRGDG